MCSSDLNAKGTGDGLSDLFSKTKGDTTAALTERAVAIWKLMRASVADAGPDPRRGRLTPVTIRENKSNKIVNVLIDFRNTVGIPRGNARCIPEFCDRYSLFDSQQNRVSPTMCDFNRVHISPAGKEVTSLPDFQALCLEQSFQKIDDLPAMAGNGRRSSFSAMADFHHQADQHAPRVPHKRIDLPGHLRQRRELNEQRAVILARARLIRSVSIGSRSSTGTPAHTPARTCH